MFRGMQISSPISCHGIADLKRNESLAGTSTFTFTVDTAGLADVVRRDQLSGYVPACAYAEPARLSESALRELPYASGMDAHP